MAAPAKRSLVYGVLFKKESTYNTAVTPAAGSDGVHLQFSDRHQASLGVEAFDFDGSLGPSLSSLGESARVAPSGKSISADLPMRFRGPGAAYSASVLPDGFALMEAAGFTWTLDSTSSSESYTAAPTGDVANPASGTAYYYGHGELRKSAGTICDWSYTFDNQAPPMHTFRALGVYSGTLTDVAVPSITYPNADVVPPLAGQITLSIGGVTSLIVYSGSFQLGRSIDNPRVPLNGTGTHLGFLPSGRSPRLRLVVERPALTTYNYETKRDTAASEAVELTFGSTQYNMWTHSFPQAQLISATPTTRNSVATLDLEFAACVSAPDEEDDMEIVWE